MSKYYGRRRSWLHNPFVILILIGLGIAVLVWQFSQNERWSSDKLAHEGYTNVVLTGWKPITLWCSGREGIAEGFTGRSPTGEQRDGYVCNTLFFSYIVD